MAGFKSTYECNNYLAARYNATTFPTIATLYCALFTSMPTAGGGGTELTIGSLAYARVAVTVNTTNFSVASAAQIVNSTIIDFGTPTGAGWSTLAGAGWYDASTGGNLISAGPFSPARTGTAGLQFYIPVSGFVATEV